MNEYSNSPLVTDLAKHCRDEATMNHKCIYFITTTYLDSLAAPLTAFSATIRLDKFHKAFLSRLFRTRHFNRPTVRNNEPTLYCYLDAPASKKKTTNQKRTNHSSDNAFHHHCIVIADESLALKLNALCDKTNAAGFVEEHQSRIRLRTLDVQRVPNALSDLLKVCDYATDFYTKQIRFPRNDVSNDDLLTVFPKSSSEFQDGKTHQTHQRKPAQSHYAQA